MSRLKSPLPPNSSNFFLGMFSRYSSTFLVMHWPPGQNESRLPAVTLAPRQMSTKCHGFVLGAWVRRKVSGQMAARAMALATLVGLEETPSSLATLRRAFTERFIAATRATIWWPSFPQAHPFCAIHKTTREHVTRLVSTVLIILFAYMTQLRR